MDRVALISLSTLSGKEDLPGFHAYLILRWNMSSVETLNDPLISSYIAPWRMGGRQDSLRVYCCHVG